jgi:hypothetical protein
VRQGEGVRGEGNIGCWTGGLTPLEHRYADLLKQRRICMSLLEFYRQHANRLNFIQTASTKVKVTPVEDRP